MVPTINNCTRVPPPPLKIFEFIHFYLFSFLTVAFQEPFLSPSPPRSPLHSRSLPPPFISSLPIPYLSYTHPIPPRFIPYLPYSSHPLHPSPLYPIPPLLIPSSPSLPALSHTSPTRIPSSPSLLSDDMKTPQHGNAATRMG